MLKKIKTTVLIIILLLILTQIKIFANTVEYRGGADALITTPNDFFLNFEELLPGDTKQDVAYIKNSTNEKIEIFFKTEPLQKSEYYDEIDYSLLNQIQLTITLKQTPNSEEQLLYKGNLGAELMNEYISLGEYTNGYNGEFIFKIEVPTTLKNEYTLSSTKVKWIFAVETKEELQKNEEQNNTLNIMDIVKTGDNIFYMIATIVLLVIVIIIVNKIKRNRKGEDKNI